MNDHPCVDCEEELGQLRRACASYVEVLAARDEEIKRLRADLAETSDSLRVAAKALNDEERENERLRDVIDRAAKAWLLLEPGVAFEGDIGGAMTAAVAEIKRLRNLFTLQTNQDAACNKARIAGWEQERELLSAEVERLRDSEARALKVLTDTDDGCRKRFAEYRAEIERLRTAIVADDEGSTAYQSGWHARDGEIERLRELVYAVPPTERATGQTWKEACEANREEVARLARLLRDTTTLCEEKDARIERLRAKVQEWANLALDHVEVIVGLHAEIERLCGRESLRSEGNTE